METLEFKKLDDNLPIDNKKLGLHIRNSKRASMGFTMPKPDIIPTSPISKSPSGSE
jgi:hypothetical protein